MRRGGQVGCFGRFEAMPSPTGQLDESRRWIPPVGIASSSAVRLGFWRQGDEDG
jgi:hypothetical protein